jgi:hypothetical protein
MGQAVMTHQLLRLTQVGGPLNGRHLVALALPPFLSCQLPGPKPRRTVIYRPTGELDPTGRHIYRFEEPTT